MFNAIHEYSLFFLCSQILGFEQYPPQKEIVSRCRKLSSKWHPDRFAKKNDTEQEVAETNFLNVQKACSMMNKIKMARETKNRWSTSATDETPTEFTENADVNTYSDDEAAEYDDVSEFDEDYDDYDYDTDDDDSNEENVDHDNESTEDSEDKSYCEKSSNCGK